MHVILFYEVIENFVAEREPFRAEHLKKAQEAYDRGDLVLAGALAEPRCEATGVRKPDRSRPG